MDTPTKKHGWRNQPLPRLAIIVLAAALIVYLMILKTENNPKFPYPAKGEFIQSPTIIEQGDQTLVEWKIPSSCKFNELVYSPKNDNKNWGGSGADCKTTDSTSTCSINIKTLPKETAYDVQANSRECSDGQTFISEPVSIPPESLQ
ncbi:MAG: hypothetical protein AAB733_03755 [Patescibacteria group bacterium]